MSAQSIHICGSVPLSSARDVFETVGGTLGSKIRYLPDGETGEREQWIMWQRQVFDRHPNFEAIESEGDYRNPTAKIRATTWWRLKDEVFAENVDLGVLGYAEYAKKSYEVFSTLKEDGVVDGSTRFMIALPTPYNVINMSVAPADRLAVEPAYERAMAMEVSEIAAALPHDQISIQWDVAHDMQTYEGSRQCYFAFHQDGIVERLVRMGEIVPDGIAMGYHLCYGNFGGKHFVEPRDMAPMVELANHVSGGIGRSIDWIHMPVPIERDDEPYFKALKGLRLGNETSLYLGLVHDQDGEDGCRRRMATADKFISRYGIATECGLGRRPPESIGPLLELHDRLV